MSKMIYLAVVLALVGLTLRAPVSSAGEKPEVPNINKRGDNEKLFIEKVANTILSNARTSIKKAETIKYEKKEPKEGRTEFHITATFKTAVLKQTGTATMLVLVDTADKNNWEVLRIDYDDKGFTTVAPINRKNVEALVAKMNGKK